MIDVVFLLLVFFMVAARFGAPQVLPLQMGAGVAAYDGPPRLVSVTPGDVRVNGVVVSDPVAALLPLMAQPEDIIAVRPEGDVSVARLTEVLVALRDGGLTALALVEARP